MQIGEMVKKHRVRQGLSQSAVAEKAGISYVMLGLIERNQTNPTLEILHKISEALDCDFRVKIVKRKTDPVLEK